ncbi:MAG: class I SAM-dependent methyltransferase [Candidatus Margulisiibacteriota bacterium]
MLISPTGPQNLRFSKRAKTEVIRAERKFPGAKSTNNQGFSSFITQGPNNPVYAAIPPALLLPLIERLQLSADLHYASFGLGLGMDCFAVAKVFKKVTGYEIDPKLVAEAERIKTALGLENVSFRNQDFLTIPADEMNQFDVVVFFRPFKDNFFRLMGNKLRELRSGATAISYAFYHPLLFPSRQFDPLYPTNWNPPEENIASEFYVFRRK